MWVGEARAASETHQTQPRCGDVGCAASKPRQTQLFRGDRFSDRIGKRQCSERDVRTAAVLKSGHPTLFRILDFRTVGGHGGFRSLHSLHPPYIFGSSSLLRGSASCPRCSIPGQLQGLHIRKDGSRTGKILFSGSGSPKSVIIRNHLTNKQRRI